MLSKTFPWWMFSRKQEVLPPIVAMADKDVDVIVRYAISSWSAAGKSETHREEAIAVYRKNLPLHAQSNIYMKFMAEVDTVSPDMSLRAYYRNKIRNSIP